MTPPDRDRLLATVEALQAIDRPPASTGERVAAEWIRAGQKAGQFDAALPPRSIVALVAGAVTLPFLNPRLFPPDGEAAVSFVRGALGSASRRKKR